MMFIRVGSRSSINSGRSDVGRGSNEQEVGFDFKIVAFSSASVMGWNEWKFRVILLVSKSTARQWQWLMNREKPLAGMLQKSFCISIHSIFKLEQLRKKREESGSPLWVVSFSKLGELCRIWEKWQSVVSLVLGSVRSCSCRIEGKGMQSVVSPYSLELWAAMAS